MNGNRRLTRRQRLLLTTTLSSLAILAAASAAVFVRRAPGAYNPGESAEGITAELARHLPADYPRVTFTEVSQPAGIGFRHFHGDRSTQLPEDMGSGAAWGDYDNDGDDDLFVVNVCGPLTLPAAEARRSPATCRLYRNHAVPGGDDGKPLGVAAVPFRAGHRAPGTGHPPFTDVSREAGLARSVCGMGAAWGDIDGDGWLDLVITSYPDLLLFRNNRRGGFADVSRASGLDRHKGFWTGASWSDYDKDGDLDLYVCGYVRYRFDPANWKRVSLQFQGEVPFTLNPSSYEPERNLLLQNDGHGVFTDVAKAAGVENARGRSLSAAWCDFDGDGWDDLYVANDVSNSAMFRNLGNGRFADIGETACVAEYRGSMGLGIGDWDGDSDMDIYVTHWIAQQHAFFNNMRIFAGVPRPGKLLFTDAADQFGLGQLTLDYIGWGTSFFDYDNDGRPDLFVVNGSTFEEEKDRRRLIPMRHLLFWNRSNEQGFFELARASGLIFTQETVGRGAAFADYDEDGDVDVFVVNHGGSPWLLRNDGGSQKHWLKVRVRGHRNRFGVGAKVKIALGGRTQVQQIGAQSSYCSQNSLTAHFGLDQAATVDEVIVTFPSGKSVRRQAVKSNQTLTIGET
jgi:hypothetical protein